MTIDKNFILKYAPRYDCTENDEEQYRNLVKRFSGNISYITRYDFEDLINWKYAPMIGKIPWDRFPNYQETFRKLDTLNNRGKLEALDDLPYIAVPMASTILHFSWPDTYPIIDVRTIGTLKHYGYIDWKIPSHKHYWKFFEIIHHIKKTTDFSLRSIDRALFAYHKSFLKTTCHQKYKSHNPTSPKSFADAQDFFYTGNVRRNTFLSFLLSKNPPFENQEGKTNFY